MNRPGIVAATTGWGLYCACSWTWCIGMFLPVILLGRHGWWGFLAFAVPNVLGCATFGYVLRTRECSLEVVRRHRFMFRVFSLVTVAYHVFFLGFVCWLLLPVESGEQTLMIALAVPVVVMLLGQVLADVPVRVWPVLAVFVYAFSLIVFASIGVQPLSEIAWRGSQPTVDAAWLAPVMIFGFLLCPYLDLTFHRALQESPSKHAFGVFGITFAVMIVLTCAYWDVLTTGLSWLVLGHVMVQAVFTIGAHLREVRSVSDQTAGASTVTTRLVMLSPLLALPIAFLAAFSLQPLEASVDSYLRFLVFYGLVFPAYALLFMGRSAFGLTRRGVTLFVVICLAFMPLYEAGFLHGHAWVLLGPPIVFALWRAKRALGIASGLPERENVTQESVSQ